MSARSATGISAWTRGRGWDLFDDGEYTEEDGNIETTDPLGFTD